MGALKSGALTHRVETETRWRQCATWVAHGAERLLVQLRRNWHVLFIQSALVVSVAAPFRSLVKQWQRALGVWGVVGCVGATACAVDEPLAEPSSAPLATGERGVEIEESGPSIGTHAANAEEGTQPQRAARTVERAANVRPTLSPEVAQRLKGSLNERLTRSVDGLPRYTLPGVGDSVDTRGRFQHVVVQTRDSNGQLHTECFENQAQLERALGTAVSR